MMDVTEYRYLNSLETIFPGDVVRDILSDDAGNHWVGWAPVDHYAYMTPLEVSRAKSRSLLLDFRRPTSTTPKTDLSIKSGEGIQVSDVDKFRAHIKRVSAIVKSWPLWKQNILQNSMKPTVSVPRTPVDNNKDQIT